MALDLAQAYTEAMATKDLDALDDLLADDVCVVTPKGTVLEGIDAVKRYYSGDGFDHLVATTEDNDFEAHASGGVRHLARQVYRWKETGEEAYARPLETFFEFADGRIVRVEMRILSANGDAG
jgi:ketosteroid isomerase-like protein